MTCWAYLLPIACQAPSENPRGGRGEAGGPRQRPAENTVLALIATSGGETEHGIGLVDQTFGTTATFLGNKYPSLLAPGLSRNTQELTTNEALRGKAEAFGREPANE